MKDNSATLRVSYGRRAASYWFVDGLPEILLGLTLVVFGVLAWLWGIYGPRRLAGLGWLILYAGLLLYFVVERDVLGFLKWRITYPRTGYVQPPEEAEGRPQILTTLSLRPMPPVNENVTFFRRRTVGAIGLFLYVLLPNPPGHWLVLVPLVMPVLAATLYAVNWKSEHPYRWWAVLLLALTGLPFFWVDVPVPLQRTLPFLLAGGWFVAVGVCTLVKYLYVNPLPRPAEGARA